MHNISPHFWIGAPYTQDQEETWKTLAQHADSRYVLNCHRNIGGLYTGARDLLTQIVPVISERYPDLIERHAVEILSIAPDLRSIVPTPLGNLTSLAVAQERTRFYALTRTQRLAHGIIELLIEYVRCAEIKCFSLFFSNADVTDALDLEFIAALLRRTRSQPFLIAVGTTSEHLPETLLLAVERYTQMISLSSLSIEERASFLQDRNIPQSWHEWFLHSTKGWRSEWEFLSQLPTLLSISPPQDQTFEQSLSTILLQCPQTIRENLARAYVESDCTSENPLERIAYQLTEIPVRQQMHDVRGSALEQLHLQGCSLGAVVYHYERGEDPAGRGAEFLAEAINYCFDEGYYEAVCDYGMRGCALVDKEIQLRQYWNFMGKLITALSILDRVEEAEQYCKEMRAFTSRASIHIQLSYKTAMHYTRYFKGPQRDHMLAKEWMQVALALIDNIKIISEGERVFMTVFHMNALALIEMHLNRTDEALRLIADGRKRMDEEFDPGTHQLHRSVLLHNRGQVYALLKQYEKALEAFSEVIESDPYYSEYYFDRGNTYRQLARYEEALEDYAKAILYSPPYPEVHYNRASVLSLLGREDEALVDYTYSFELDPSFDLALVNRVGILYAQGRYEEARQDIVDGFVLHPDNPQLLCTLGLIEMVEEHPDDAYQAFTAALEGEPTLREAWSNRAVLEFERGNVAAAINDLSHALETGADATILYNRGFAYQAMERWQEAIADYTQALALEDADKQELFYQRAVCYLQENLPDLAQQDFEAHLKIGDSAHMDEICRLVPSLSLWGNLDRGVTLRH
jgi:tetratricopeptide (TPR) repeat protein